MADEGLFRGLFGEEEGEAPDSGDAVDQVTRADIVAATLAADHARSDPRVARATQSFLEEQAGLLKAQARHQEDEHALRLELLQERRNEGRLRRFGQRIRLATQLATALIVTLLGIGLVVMLVDAFRSETVIVDAFDAPAALAPRGLTGKVVASAVLDELTRLQDATHITLGLRKLSNAWAGDIKVQLPETGVSIGDIDHLLKERFGHDVHVGGDLVQTETGRLALTIRGDNILPKTFTADAGDFPRLAAQGAEYAFGQSQPRFLAAYLEIAGRSGEAAIFCRQALATASIADRPDLLLTWGDSLADAGGSPQDTLPLYLEALKINPHFWAGYNNVINDDLLIGDEESAWRAGEALRRAAGGRPGHAPEIYYQNWDFMTWNIQAWRSALIADAARHGGVGTSTLGGVPLVGDVDVRLHDVRGAEFELQKRLDNDPVTDAVVHFVRGRLAAETGDTQRAAAEMEAFGASYGNPIVSSNLPGYECWIAPAEEAAGFPDKADAALATGGRYVDCHRFRGDILDRRGDWTGAQAAYALAVSIAPDLPAGYHSWGLALARHGDPAGAVAKFTKASQAGPHWADPLKAWGDVLAREGRWGDALAKYDRALRYAPDWAELHLARDAAARQRS